MFRKFRLSEPDSSDPGTLLVFRTLLGLTKEEFAYSSVLAAALANLRPLTSTQIDTME
jgi:hypothetical protein